MKNFIFKLMMLFFLEAQTALANCPTSPVDIAPEVKVDYSFDKKSQDYIYNYKIQNASTAKTSLRLFEIESPLTATAIQLPTDWDMEFQAAFSNEPSTITLSTSFNEIAPGKSLEFKFKSKLGPGPVKYYALGRSSGQLKAITVNGDNEVAPICPGFFTEDSSVVRSRVSGVVIGPVPANQVEAKLKMKLLKEKPRKGEDDEADEPEVSPADEGTVELVLRHADGVDLSAVDLSSITFGPYETSPVSSELILGDQKIKHWRNKPHEKKLIIMKFKLSDLKIRCELDRALLFKANAGDKKLVGAVMIKPKICDKNLMEIHSKRLKMDKKNYHPRETEH